MAEKKTTKLPDWIDEDALKGLLDLYEEGSLQDMLTWWSEHKAKALQSVQYRPAFKGPRRNSGVHVSTEILSRAMEKAKGEKAKTGGSLSMLVELLLWRYIGSPEDLIEGTGSAEPETTIDKPNIDR